MRRWYLAPRWLGLHLVVLLALVACALLGRWQLDRAQAQHAASRAPIVNATRTPVPIDDVLRPGTLIGSSAIGRRVTISGSYDAAAQVLVPDRRVDGLAGVAVLTPLVTPDGAAVVVDRGFLPTGTTTSVQAGVPPPPSGTVDVTGWLAASEDAPPLAEDPPAGELGSIHLPSLANVVPHPLYDGYLRLAPDSAGAGASLRAEPIPELVGGGHWPLQNIFYAIEWWFFGLAAVGFWVATMRRGPVRPAAPPAA